jgi:hypothetical protein
VKFMLLHYVVESDEPDATRACVADGTLDAWLEETIASGVNLDGSYLQPSRNAATVRTRDGELLISDGPFAETKEQIAGYDIIECADLKTAIEVAARHPTARGHGTIEVRPFPAQ